MFHITGIAPRRLLPVLAALLCVSLLMPSWMSAQEAGSSTAVTVAPLNMRSSPGVAEPIVSVIPSGTTVDVVGSAQAGFLPVAWNGWTGWSSADYLTISGSGESTIPSDTGTAQTVAPLNFRSGPDTTYGVISVIPAGASVTQNGESSNGFVSISYDGYTGWVAADYITTGGTEPAPNPEPAPSIGTATTTAALHLRSGPDGSNASLTVMPAGATVDITGGAENGFLPVAYSGISGWASADYLSTGDEAPAPAPDPGSGGSGIIWPVSGGTWSIIQGYNGGTHQNRSASAQYYYALDIARTDGDTAGQAIYAPASGTILWTDPGSGGIAIDMGNGYIVAMFHGTFDGGLGRGQAVQQGQYLGTVSGPGGPGYASTPHIDMTLWQSGDGGSSRSATPYTGGNAISGMEFPDVGGWNQHGGTTFNP